MEQVTNNFASVNPNCLTLSLGITVGILSDSFSCLGIGAGQATNDIPSVEILEERSSCSGATDEGFQFFLNFLEPHLSLKSSCTQVELWLKSFMISHQGRRSNSAVRRTDWLRLPTVSLNCNKLAAMSLSMMVRTRDESFCFCFFYKKKHNQFVFVQFFTSARPFIRFSIF